MALKGLKTIGRSVNRKIVKVDVFFIDQKQNPLTGGDQALGKERNLFWVVQSSSNQTFIQTAKTESF